jgi:ribose transport system substrate-binding protein
MTILVRSMTRSHLAGGATALLALSLAAACSTTSSGGAAPTNTESGAPATTAPADPELQAVYDGTLTSPDTKSRPAVKGKKVVIISSGQSSISSSIPVNAAEEAAKKMGWEVAVYDAQLNPANDANLMDQAIASGADGIILDAIDCQFVKSQMEQAKAKGIFTVPIYAYDCDDQYAGQGGERLFSAYIDYGPEANRNLGAFAEKYGYAQGKAAVAATGGKAKVVFFNSPTTTVLHYTGNGFLRAIDECSGCEVLANVKFTGLDLGPQLLQKASSVLLQHPDANVVKSPYTAATLLSIAPAVRASGHAGDLYVMGGEGFNDELNLLRNHQGVDAVMISPSDWTGWAAVDTLNSLFRGEDPAFSGLGWQLVDETHNLPPSGPWESPVDFEKIYLEAWGLS